MTDIAVLRWQATIRTSGVIPSATNTFTMRNLATLLLICMCSMNGQAQSYSVQSLDVPLTYGFEDIYFLNADTGFIHAQGEPLSRLLKTTNGGQSWTVALIVPNPLREICFVTADVGYVVGDGGIHKTMDGGDSWEVIRDGVFHSVAFTSPDTGFAAGIAFGGLGVWKTTNAGATWYQVFDEESSFLHFLDASYGFVSVVRWPFTEFYRTIDAGETWTSLTIQGLNLGAVGFYFASVDTGYVAEWEQGIFKTTDGCASWTPLYLGGVFYCHAIHFLDADHGFAVGAGPGNAGLILHTVDGGESWTVLYSSPESSVLTDIHFPVPWVGYVTGNGGVVLKITENGVGLGSEGSLPEPMIYPNPTSGTFHLRSPSQDGTVTITNALGGLVAQERIMGTSAMPFTIDQNGSYLVDVQSGEHRWRSRVVVCR